MCARTQRERERLNPRLPVQIQLCLQLVITCLKNFYSQTWSRPRALYKKSQPKELCRVMRWLQKGAGNLYCQQTNREPISNCREYTWELLSNTLVCWSFAWWNNFRPCRSQSCNIVRWWSESKVGFDATIQRLGTNKWTTVMC